MSKKNLARTLIEGGRGNTWERRYETRLERGRARQWLKKNIVDEELSEAEPAPMRKPVRREFNDKLHPLKRWLVAQHGRSWNDVYSELSGMFDVRTTAGRHLLHDHVEGYVNFRDKAYPRWIYQDDHPRYYDVLMVEDDGVLYYYPRDVSRTKRWRTNAVVTEWVAGDRRIRLVGDEPFWFEPVYHPVEHWLTGYRQGRRLSAGEFNAWARTF